MSLYLEQIRQLVALQHVDDDIFLILQELKSAPQEVEELSQSFAVQEAQRSRVLDKLQHLREQQKRLDLDIEDDSTRIKKSKSKLLQVANNREYQAMVREMDNMERSNRSREEERLALLEEKNLQDGNLAEIETSWGKIKAELDEKSGSLELRIKEAKDKLKALENKRANTGSEVPAPVLSRYEFIRRRLDHPVIVSVDNGVCSGCHIAIPPQVFIELQGGQKILSCPNCQRLIYWVQHFQDTTGQIGQKPAAKPVSKKAEEPETEVE